MTQFCYDKREIETAFALNVKNSCRYHKKSGESLKYQNFAPENLCMEAFSVAYPFCLSLLYGATPGIHCEINNVNTILKCPNPYNFITFKIKVYENRFKKKLKDCFIRLLRFADIHAELPTKKLKIEVIKNEGCPKNYIIGKEFEFNVKNQNELCPASFSAIFPFLNKKNYQNFPCFDNNKIEIHCPDPRGIIYKLK